MNYGFGRAKEVPGRPSSPLTLNRLAAIAQALVVINEKSGHLLTLEEAEEYAVRILADERES